jgi:hypothetical protein
MSGRADDLRADDRRAPADAASGAGGGEAFAGAGDDELADELGQGGEDVEDEPTAGGGGVQVLVQALEPDVAGTQVADGGDQML